MFKNGQIAIVLSNNFKKGQMATMVKGKRGKKFSREHAAYTESWKTNGKYFIESILIFLYTSDINSRVAKSRKMKKAKFGHKWIQKGPKKSHINIENLSKYIKQILKYCKMLYALLKFCQNKPQKDTILYKI